MTNGQLLHIGPFISDTRVMRYTHLRSYEGVTWEGVDRGEGRGGEGEGYHIVPNFWHCIAKKVWSL